ncbi:MAG: hypothetical protein VB035_10370 [Candidatus Fimivivens sp.]|nr:hypothetical protein [Candidatus Fimivivens sp.]
MISEKVDSAKTLWRSVLGIVMVCAGCACFVLSCVAAMILAGRE